MAGPFIDIAQYDTTGSINQLHWDIMEIQGGQFPIFQVNVFEN